MARESIALPLPAERVERDAETARSYNPRDEEPVYPHVPFATVGDVLQGKRARVKREKRPSLKTLERWIFDGVAEATDGCRVEPDGSCPHGCQSWLIELGLI